METLIIEEEPDVPEPRCLCFESRRPNTELMTAHHGAPGPRQRESVRGICEQPVVSQLRGAGSTYGDFVRLAPTEHSLLLRFLKNLVKLVGDADLLGRFWGQEFHETTDYLKVDVMHLRRTVGDDSGNLIAIGTECGSCFVLVPDQVPRIGEGLVVGLA